MSRARQLFLAASTALALAAGGLLPATAAAGRSAHTRNSPHARISAHASRGHRAASHHSNCKRRASSPRGARGCVRGSHSSHRRSNRTARKITARRSASLAAAIAAVLATPCQNTEIVPEIQNLDVVREAVLCLINHVRAQHGEMPLKLDADLGNAAQEHSQELVDLNYFAHVSPSGETPVDRIRRTGYIPGPNFGYVIGENLAWGTLTLSTPQAIVSAWVASPGHLANILEGAYEETGIGVVAAVPPSLGGGQQGATYSQEFGVIVG